MYATCTSRIVTWSPRMSMQPIPSAGQPTVTVARGAGWNTTSADDDFERSIGIRCGGDRPAATSTTWPGRAARYACSKLPHGADRVHVRPVPPDATNSDTLDGAPAVPARGAT